ncbi:MAG TPA: hypothetical protein DEP28_00605 [Bacteroidetes bacterium]|nr:hypothetical protein [Bacteroidota bacterium]HCN36386.1 hypothetical protein [Bacteroidota bacterium]
MKKFFIIIISLIYVNSYSQLSSDGIVITTKLKEKFYDKNGNVLTGKGVVIGDMDSGIDVFHPMFFFADGDVFEWIDVNKDKKFTPGTDAVDLNKNGKADSDEILNYISMKDKTFGLLGAKSSEFQADFDFLYNDKNNNKKRDFGEKDGFNESDPTYGELFFIVDDKDKNNSLTVGEKLTALKTSKVRAVREKDGTIRRRGIDLIKTEPDTIVHGTPVAGIIMGGHYGVQRHHGIAPDAEMIFANIDYKYTPRYVRNFPDLVNFLKNENVNILLIEDGEWMWEFMDGSTEEEMLMNEMARDGVTIIGGAGNMGGAKMLMKDTVEANESYTYIINSKNNAEGVLNNGIFTSILWRTPDNKINFSVETPDGKVTKEFSDGTGMIYAGDYKVFYSREISPKGTVMMKFGFFEKDSGSVLGKWKINVTSRSEEILTGFTGDVSQSWEGSSHWLTNVTDFGNVTFPCTGDSVIAVGAYTVNFPFYPGDKIGDLSYYSGIGYTITGKLGVDITAPGHTTFSCEPDYTYGIFSGTSAAAPHVVGAAALLLQYNPSLTHSEIRNILLSTATYDNFTGKTPNEKWGYGKLNIEAALKKLISN